MNNQTETIKLQLTSEMLFEMQKIAMTVGAPPSASYTECQQLITLKSLEIFLQTYGIELPISVDKLGGFRVVEQAPSKR